MIDTIRFEPCPIGTPEPHPGWAQTNWERTPEMGADPEATWLWQHHETGMRIGGNEYGARWAEVSAPRVLFGANHRCIRNADQLSQALYGSCEIARQILPGFEFNHFTRVDLVYQFRKDPRWLVSVHRNQRHPWVRSHGCEWFGESISWIGKETRIRLYDKAKEVENKAGDVARLEAQLRGAKLRKLIAGHQKRKVEALTWDRCLRAYEWLLMGFQPVSAAKVSGLTEFLVLAEQEGWRASDGRTAVEIWLEQKSDRQRRRTRREMNRVRLKRNEWDWWKAFYPDGIKAGPVPPAEEWTHLEAA